MTKYAVEITEAEESFKHYLQAERNAKGVVANLVCDLEKATTWPSRRTAEDYASFYLENVNNIVSTRIIAIDETEISLTLEDLWHINRAMNASKVHRSQEIISKIDTVIRRFKDNQGVRDSITTVLAHLDPEHDKELIRELENKLKSLQSPESIVIRVTKND